MDSPVIVQEEDVKVSGLPDQDGTTKVEEGVYVQHEDGVEAELIKSSHNCCGCCCDTRRAVIVVNAISMLFAILSIIALVTITSDNYAANFDDDASKSALSAIDGKAIGLTIGTASAGLLCSGAGIFGALKFNNIGIVVASVWYVAETVRSLAFLDAAGVVMALCFLYPHVVFFREMRAGIMTPSNYPNEERCCGCCGGRS